MRLSKQLKTVTPFSKYLALFLFISLPFVGFYFGAHYQKGITPLPIRSSTTVPGTNWKTYTSSDYSFEYPSDGTWKTSESMQPAGKQITVTCSPRCNKDSFITFSIEQWTYASLDEFKSKEGSKYELFTQSQNTSIDGEPAVKGIVPGIAKGGYCCTQLVYYVVHNGKGYHMQYEIPKLNLKTFAELPTIEPEFLSTFKFND